MSTSLYHLEDELVAMLNSVDMVENPEQRAEVEAQIIALNMQAVEKRDRVSQFIAHCENQEEFISSEIERLSKLRDHFESTRKRVESYVLSVIKSLGKDDRGQWRKLEGKTCSFGVAKNPAKVEVTALDDVPNEYKSMTVKMSANDWERLMEFLPIEEYQALPITKEATANKSRIKAALDKGVAVPGAKMSEETHRLNRK